MHLVDQVCWSTERSSWSAFVDCMVSLQDIIATGLRTHEHPGHDAAETRHDMRLQD